MVIDDVATAIAAHRFLPADEYELQAALLEVLQVRWPGTRREVPTATGRLDLLVDRVAVEVKIHGSAAEVARQLTRYARLDFVDGVVLVTTRAAHLKIARELAGKPVRVVALLTGGL